MMPRRLRSSWGLPRGASVRVVRRVPLAAVIALIGLASSDAGALDWPSVLERTERGLTSSDAATRRSAARALRTIDRARATPLVLRALEDPDVDVRLEAARTAQSLQIADATEAAAGWLGERDPRLRTAACELAHAAPSQRSVQAIARALGDSEANVRIACASALGASGSPEATAPLAGKLEDSSPNVRAEIAHALGRLGDERAVLPLVGKTQDSSPEVRRAVIRALGALGDPRATQALLLSLKDGVSEIKVEALLALGRLRAPESVESMALLTKDATPAVRNAAIGALANVGTREAARMLVRSLGIDEDALAGIERTPVRDALVRMGRVAEPELLALMSRPISVQIAASAAWVLGELHAKTSAPVIVAALRRGALETAAALHALCGAGSSRELSIVLEFLGDRDPEVRAQARAAARAILDPSEPDGRAIDPIATALRSAKSSPGERAELATLLGRTGSARAAPELVELAQTGEKSVQLAALDALALLAPSTLERALTVRIETTLASHVRHADSEIRLRAAMALAAVGGEHARELLLSMLGGEEPVDKYTALTALGGILARHADERAVRVLLGEFTLATGPERDALMFSFSRARLPVALEGLARIQKATDPADRRAVAAALAEHAPASAARHAALSLLHDADATVRAEAAFSLGTLGERDDLPLVAALSRDGDPAVATNASASLSRFARRFREASSESARATLTVIQAQACDLLESERSGVRSNALAALLTLDARCAGGQRERVLLSSDPNELVRANAARALRASTSDEDRKALARCWSTERSIEVAKHCARRRDTESAPSSRTEWVTIFVADDARGSTIKPGVPYLLEYPDGSLRAGISDRRGAIVDPFAPVGELRLRR